LTHDFLSNGCQEEAKNLLLEHDPLDVLLVDIVDHLVILPNRDDLVRRYSRAI
jgi:hypothetical protein